MKEKNLEVVKTILIDELHRKLARRGEIDLELAELKKTNYQQLDQKMIQLEKELNQISGIIEKIKKRLKIKQNTMELMNLQIQKTALVVNQTKKEQDLLQEKQLLAHNEYSYESRIIEVAKAKTWEELSLTAEELNVLSMRLNGENPIKQDEISYHLQYQIPQQKAK